MHCGLRKRPKTVKIWPILKMPFQNYFLNFFSAHSAPIIFQFFASCQVSRDTSLEYPQWVVWKNLKITYSAIFHMFSCFEQGDHKSFRAGPYCFWLIISYTCLPLIIIFVCRYMFSDNLYLISLSVYLLPNTKMNMFKLI